MIRNNSALLPSGALAADDGDYVDHLRGSPRRSRPTTSTARPISAGKHPFREATVRRPRPGGGHRRLLRARVPAGGSTAADRGRRTSRRSEAPYDAGAADPPSGVDPGAFFDLAGSRREPGAHAGSWRSTPPTTTPAWCWSSSGAAGGCCSPGDAELKSWQHDGEPADSGRCTSSRSPTTAATTARSRSSSTSVLPETPRRARTSRARVDPQRRLGERARRRHPDVLQAPVHPARHPRRPSGKCSRDRLPG